MESRSGVTRDNLKVETCRFSSLKGARRDLETAEVRAQTWSLLSTSPIWCRSRRVRLMEPSLSPFLAKGYPAYGTGYFLTHSFCFPLYSIPLDHLCYCNCLSKTCPYWHFSHYRKSRMLTPVCCMSGSFLQTGDEICQEGLQSPCAPHSVLWLWTPPLSQSSF